MKRRILLINLGVPFGGVERYLISLAKILAAEADLFALCVNPNLASALKAEGVRVVPECAIRNRGKILNLIVAMSVLIWMRFSVGISAVWVNGSSEIVLLPIAKLLGCRALATRHLSMHSKPKDWYSDPGQQLAQKMYQRMASVADKIFCVSHAVARDIQPLVNEGRLVVIPNWVPALPNQTSFTSKKRGLHLLFVGRLQPYKGAALIIDAMRRIQAKGGSDHMSLTIVGEGECRSELESLAAGLNVRFAGFQKDPTPFYREADVFINPSLGPEGLPLVSLEAMSYGLPCIFSDLSVHEEITDRGEAALLFHSGSAADLCDRLDQLAASEQVKQRYGERARATILARHSVEAAREAYVDQLEAVLGMS